MASLDISPEKVGHVIIKAREYDAKVGAWDEGDSTERDSDSILEDFGDDPTRAELKGFISTLNVDEQVSLVALMWIGEALRPDELEEALRRRARAGQSDRRLSPRHSHARRLSRRGSEKLGYRSKSRRGSALTPRPKPGQHVLSMKCRFRHGVKPMRDAPLLNE
jgi:hypothetical protein